MSIPIAVLVLGTVVFVIRWTWKAMQRSNDPAAQEAVETFKQHLDDLHAALGRLWDAIIHPK